MIRLDDDRQGIHTIHMRVNVRGIAPSQISNTSGRLFWDETGIDALISLVKDREQELKVREQALFWLAQSESDAALEEIDRLLSDG